MGKIKYSQGRQAWAKGMGSQILSWDVRFVSSVKRYGNNRYNKEIVTYRYYEKALFFWWYTPYTHNLLRVYTQKPKANNPTHPLSSRSTYGSWKSLTLRRDCTRRSYDNNYLLLSSLKITLVICNSTYFIIHVMLRFK